GSVETGGGEGRRDAGLVAARGGAGLAVDAVVVEVPGVVERGGILGRVGGAGGVQLNRAALGDRVRPARIGRGGRAVGFGHTQAVGGRHLLSVVANDLHAGVVAGDGVQLAVRLQVHPPDALEGGRRRRGQLAGAVECRVERAVGVVAGQGQDVTRVGDEDPSADQDLAVGLHDDVARLVVAAGEAERGQAVAVDAGVRAAIRVEAGDDKVVVIAVRPVGI